VSPRSSRKTRLSYVITVTSMGSAGRRGKTKTKLIPISLIQFLQLSQI